jgi:hypothetical protein
MAPSALLPQLRSIYYSNTRVLGYAQLDVLLRLLNCFQVPSLSTIYIWLEFDLPNEDIDLIGQSLLALSTRHIRTLTMTFEISGGYCKSHPPRQISTFSLIQEVMLASSSSLSKFVTSFPITEAS